MRRNIFLWGIVATSFLGCSLWMSENTYYEYDTVVWDSKEMRLSANLGPKKPSERIQDAYGDPEGGLYGLLIELEPILPVTLKFETLQVKSLNTGNIIYFEKNLTLKNNPYNRQEFHTYNYFDNLPYEDYVLDIDIEVCTIEKSCDTYHIQKILKTSVVKRKTWIL